MKRLSILGLCAIAGISIASAQEQLEIETTQPDDMTTTHSFFMNFGGSYLGVQLNEVTSENKGDLGLKKESGAVIAKVMKDSPAEKAGLQEKDVVVGWNGTPVASVRQLVRLVHETPAGRTVTIDVIRNGQPTQVEAEIGKGEMFNGMMPQGFDSTLNIQMMELNKEIEGMKPGLDSLGNCLKSYKFNIEGMPHGMMMFCGGKPRLGVEMQELTPQLAKYFGATEGAGALISSVIDSTPAATAGLQAGDVILSIDGEAINGSGDVMRVLQGKEEGPVQIRVLRDKHEQTITAVLGKKEANSPFQMFKGEQFKLDGKGPHKFEFKFRGPNGEEQIIKSPNDSDEDATPEAPEQDDDMDFSMTAPQIRHQSMRIAPPGALQPPPHWAPTAIGLIEI